MGKKKATRKTTRFADPSRDIRYLGPTTRGATHDYQMLKNEFAAHLGLLDRYRLLVLADLATWA
ncbi:hypothetical protein [uncultured Hymenobacter sp.]|uniref:hypothetical protein n=1 Tax=uncultured Hymenobacter sp. TaxID=170016 RepID=UPI0035CB4088